MMLSPHSGWGAPGQVQNQEGHNGMAPVTQFAPMQGGPTMQQQQCAVQQQQCAIPPHMPTPQMTMPQQMPMPQQMAMPPQMAMSQQMQAQQMAMPGAPANGMQMWPGQMAMPGQMAAQGQMAMPGQMAAQGQMAMPGQMLVPMPAQPVGAMMQGGQQMVAPNGMVPMNGGPCGGCQMHTMALPIGAQPPAGAVPIMPTLAVPEIPVPANMHAGGGMPNSMGGGASNEPQDPSPSERKKREHAFKIIDPCTKKRGRAASLPHRQPKDRKRGDRA